MPGPFNSVIPAVIAIAGIAYAVYSELLPSGFFERKPDRAPRTSVTYVPYAGVIKYVAPDDIDEVLRLIGARAGRRNRLREECSTKEALLEHLAFPLDQHGSSTKMRAMLFYPVLSGGTCVSATPIGLAFVCQKRSVPDGVRYPSIKDVYVEPGYVPERVHAAFRRKLRSDSDMAV